jgi:hypothetical protein
LNAAISRVVIALGATCGLALLSHGGDGYFHPCPKEILPEVCAADEIEDEGRRTEELDRALAEALRSGNGEVRDRAFRFVSDRESVTPLLWDDRPVDPLRLEEALLAFDALETAEARREHAKADPDDVDRIVRHHGQELLDEVGLRRAPKAERLSVYERAIVEGRAPFGKVSTMPRETAMTFSAAEGLSELAAIVAVRCPDLGEMTKASWGGCDGLAAEFELRAGAEDSVDAITRAARRLAAMPVDELFARLRASAGWRRAVAQTARSVCLVGSLEDCQGLEPMSAGLKALMRREYAGAGQPAPAATPTPDDETFKKEMMEEVFRSLTTVEGRRQHEKAAAKSRNGT